MPSKGFASISVPVSLISEIEHIVDDESQGYRNVAEFAREALRMRLSEIRSLYRSHTRNQGESVSQAPTAPVEPAVKPPQTDAGKDTSKKKRSKNALVEPQKENGNGTLDKFGVEA